MVLKMDIKNSWLFSQIKYVFRLRFINKMALGSYEDELLRITRNLTSGYNEKISKSVASHFHMFQDEIKNVREELRASTIYIENAIGKMMVVPDEQAYFLRKFEGIRGVANSFNDKIKEIEHRINLIEFNNSEKKATIEKETWERILKEPFDEGKITEIERRLDSIEFNKPKKRKSTKGIPNET